MDVCQSKLQLSTSGEVQVLKKSTATQNSEKRNPQLQVVKASLVTFIIEGGVKSKALEIYFICIDFHKVL